MDEIITLWRIDKSSAIKQINKQFFLSNGVNRFNTFTSGGVRRGGGNDLIFVSTPLLNYCAVKLARLIGRDPCISRSAVWCFFHPNTSHDFRVHPSNKFSRALLCQDSCHIARDQSIEWYWKRAMKLKEWTSI